MNYDSKYMYNFFQIRFNLPISRSWLVRILVLCTSDSTCISGTITVDFISVSGSSGF